jgi:hypothetical protein
MITITGSPSISSGGSISFNGSSQYLALASNAAFAFGTSDFTIETWIYPNNLSGRLWFFDSNTDNVDLNGNGGIYYYGSGGVYNSATNTVITVGAWHHIALVRASGTVTLYVNGSSVMSQNGIGYNSASNRAMEIAYSSSQGNGYFNGLMTNFRVVKGAAVYTSAFTAPTNPLTAITNTQLLLSVTSSGTLVTDSSTNNLTVTNTGSATYSSTTPIVSSAGGGIKITGGVSIQSEVVAVSSGSLLFSGSNYLSVAGGTGTSMGTSDFTWECWVYPTSSANYQAFIDTRTNPLSGGDTSGFYFGTNTGTLTPMYYTNGLQLASSRNITLNAWNHVALTRASGTVTIWVNGASGGTKSDTTNLTEQRVFIGSGGLGLYLTGRISNLRMAKGTVIYTTTFTPPTSPLTAISGTQLLLNTTNDANFLKDSSTNNFTVTNNGSVTSSSLNPF